MAELLYIHAVAQYIETLEKPDAHPPTQFSLGGGVFLSLRMTLLQMVRNLPTHKHSMRFLCEKRGME
ncbi:hypothetical protein NQZ68_018924 [Dissostichus eleginoides]|nr:hypothetical protein NQZ68_018924 [Dissostichus eleginoides]